MSGLIVVVWQCCARVASGAMIVNAMVAVVGNAMIAMLLQRQCVRRDGSADKWAAAAAMIAANDSNGAAMAAAGWIVVAGCGGE